MKEVQKVNTRKLSLQAAETPSIFLQMKKTRRLRCGGNVDCVLKYVYMMITVVSRQDRHSGLGVGDWSADTRARVPRVTEVRSSCHSRNVRRVVRETPNMYRAQMPSLLVGKYFIL